MPKIYSVKTAAFEMDISENQCRYLLRKGVVKGQKLGRDWVVLELNYERQRMRKGVGNVRDFERAESRRLKEERRKQKMVRNEAKS